MRAMRHPCKDYNVRHISRIVLLLRRMRSSNVCCSVKNAHMLCLHNTYVKRPKRWTHWRCNGRTKISTRLNTCRCRRLIQSSYEISVMISWWSVSDWRWCSGSCSNNEMQSDKSHRSAMRPSQLTVRRPTGRRLFCNLPSGQCLLDSH